MTACSYNFIKFSMCSYNFNVAVRISINLEHICNGGMGKVCLLCQPIVRPVPFLHQFSDSFLRIHIITYLSVSILSPRKVV